MAKLAGLFGKATGKKGDAVLAVTKGEQIMRQYNPIVSNPNTDKQVAARAKMKLMSQLSAVLANVIAIRKEGGKSPRNIFNSINYNLCSFDGTAAAINMAPVQLTKSSKGMSDFSADRSSGVSLNCALNEVTDQLDAVVYVVVKIYDDKSMRVLDSEMATRETGMSDFSVKMDYVTGSIVVYAYGIVYNGSSAKAKYENIEGDAAEHVAELFTSRATSIMSSVMTETVGLTMDNGQNTATSGGQATRHLTITVSGHGTTTGQGTYPVGTTVTCVATPDQGETFEGWYRNGIQVSVNTSYQVVLDNNMTLEAHFSGTATQYTATVTASPAAGGSVTGGGTYNSGSTVTLNASANTGYAFDGWYENNTRISSSNNFSFIISTNRTIEGRFSQAGRTYNLTLSASPSAGGTVSGGGSYQSGTNATAIATPNSGYTFLGWYEGETLVSSERNYTLAMNADHTLQARFQAGSGNEVHVTAAAYDDSGHELSGVQVTGAGTYNIGDTVNMNCPATGGANLSFASWSKHNGTSWQVVSTNNAYSFTAQEDVELRAIYEEDQE